MDYYEWFAVKVNPIVFVNGDMSIREFGAIVHRATLRGDITAQPQDGEQAEKDIHQAV